MPTPAPTPLPRLPSLLLVLLLAPQSLHAIGCLRALKQPTDAFFWREIYQEGRIKAATCFALHGIRWGLKQLKLKYEYWHVEMEYAKCLSTSYGFDLPFLTPPWSKRVAKNLDSVNWKAPISDSSRKLHDTMISEGMDGKINEHPPLHELVSVAKPYIYIQDRVSVNELYPPLSNDTSLEIQRIFNSVIRTTASLWEELELALSKQWGTRVWGCTKTYLKDAFWRWVDTAPPIIFV